MSAPVVLHGGSGSIAASFELLDHYAGQLMAACSELSRLVIPPVIRLGYDPVLVAAAVLDPVGAATTAEHSAACLAVLAVILAALECLQLELRAAARCYRAVDELDRRLRPVLRAAWQLPRALTVAGATRGWQPADPQRLVSADPELVAVAGLTLAIGGASALLVPGGIGPAAGLLAKAYPDGRPQVTTRPDLPTNDSRGAPRSIRDLLAGLATRSAADDGGGAFDVRILDGPPPAGRRVIVDLAGTTIWNLNPLHPTPQASDLGTSLRCLANESSVLERGVTRALALAGVRPDEPIMLIGHSQGGMVAARLAADLTANSAYRVTHLITAGSPIGLADVPASVSVLALENRGDLVPQLDGADNPDRPNWLTAQISRGGQTIAGKHALSGYLAGAGDLDRSQAPELSNWRLSASRFLSADTVRTEVFQVRRWR